ncbi:hypothetical protein ACF1BN_31555 [Streptomyces sp. NPDC014861]|uniref:hypothetical protein n=1 Tax=Streptomyces sp. NPDC014861 TaxID=3364923 RepID=UPI0036FA78D8
MNPFLLGLRLVWRGGRRGRARFLLMTCGSAVGVVCLAAVLTTPTWLAESSYLITGGGAVH